jgi:two-component system, LytTR family, response regulator
LPQVVFRLHFVVYKLPIVDIIMCEASNNYPIIYLQNKPKITTPKTLKVYEDILDTHSFLRVLNSYLVNLNYGR